MHLIEHFPSVKGALRLDIKGIVRALPTDAALHHFERLETVVIDTSFLIRKPSFWNDLFALKAFRRVPNIITFDYFCQDPEVDDGALFDFLTDSSLMPSGKPCVVRLGPFDDDSLRALKRRFYKIIASIGCQVFAIVLGHNKGKRYLTNMTSGRQKKTLAKQLLRAAYRVPAVNRT
ncbi:hypothetical protein AAVH_05891 [Aphelenchoides avenae]|nr:hypothetical protein AAVH_05891 [Aphelenchus avenae]